MPSGSACCRARRPKCCARRARLYHDLTQILRLCVTGKFNPKTAGEDLLRVMARAGDAPDFSSLEARIKETQAEVRRVFKAVVEGGLGRPIDADRPASPPARWRKGRGGGLAPAGRVHP